MKSPASRGSSVTVCGGCTAVPRPSERKASRMISMAGTRPERRATSAAERIIGYSVVVMILACLAALFGLHADIRDPIVGCQCYLHSQRSTGVDGRIRRCPIVSQCPAIQQVETPKRAERAQELLEFLGLLRRFPLRE